MASREVVARSTRRPCLFQARAEIAAAVSGIETARHQRDEIVARLPELERFVQGTAVAASRGDLPPPTAVAAAQALRDKQVQLAQNDQKAVWTWGVVLAPFNYFFGLRENKLRQAVQDAGVR